MQNDLAWDTTLGDSNIIVGITDDGVELTHEDLASNIFVNSGEIAGDLIDNDGNGYVDDANGWDFINDNNDANPSGGDAHGTHVSGISAGTTNNGIGIAGTSGGSTILPLKFFEVGAAWPAAAMAFLMVTVRSWFSSNNLAPAATEPDDTNTTWMPRSRQRTMN